MVYDIGIIGDGIIGNALAIRISQEDLSFYQTSRKPQNGQLYYDLERGGVLPRAEKTYLCAGQTSISQCEDDPAESYQLNVAHQIELLKSLQPTKGVVLSTNLVFDNVVKPRVGTYRSGKAEYALQKIELENFALDNGHFVVRLTKVIEKNMDLFTFWIDELRNGNDISPFEDMMFSPIYIDDVIDQLLNLDDQCTHVSASSDISYSDAALYFADKLSLNPEMIKPVRCTLNGLKPNSNTALYSSIKMEPYRALDKFIQSLF